MKSRISIDMDWDNQPIIRIDYQNSEDVRDKMVKRFMDTFGGDSYFATFFFDNSVQEMTNTRATIRPLNTAELGNHVENMKSAAENWEKFSSEIGTVHRSDN